MKKLLFLVLCLSLVQFSFAQSKSGKKSKSKVKIGIRAGASTNSLDANQLVINDQNDIESIGLTIKEGTYGLHFGAFLQAKIGKIFIQPEILFNSNKVDFEIEDFSEGQTYSSLLSERYNSLDIPVMLGLKLGPLRLQGGPVGHLFINNSSELVSLEGYKPLKEQGMTYGWQAGVGLDLWRFILDLKYEGNFTKFGDHMTFFGKDYAFDSSPGRFVASVGISF